MQALRDRFVERCRGDLVRLKVLAAGDLSADELGALAHSLAGAGGVFGFPEVSAAAGRLDDAYASGETPSPAAVAALLDELQRVVDSAG